MAEFYLRKSQCASQLSSEKTHFILQATEESQLYPLWAQSCLQLPAPSQPRCLRRPSQKAQGRFLVEEAGSPCVAGRESGRVWGNVSMSYFAVTGFQMKFLLSNNILMPWQLQCHFITLLRFDLYFSSHVSIGKSNHYDLIRSWMFFGNSWLFAFFLKKL